MSAWLNLAREGGECEVKKTYTTPVLVTFGRLEELTLGIGGTAPDVVGINNNNCLTGTLLTNGQTITITCASAPLS